MTATTLQKTDSTEFLGFDLETVRLVPGRRFDDRSALNVGISCASLALSVRFANCAKGWARV